MKKILCLLLLLALALSLGACGARDLPPVMEYGGLRLDGEVYSYWLSCYRAQFAYQETAENRARLAELTDLNIQKTLVAAATFDGYGLQLDTAARDIINAAMASLVENNGGTREALEQAAAAYGIGYDGLRLAITYEQKAQALFNYLFGANGAYAVSDEECEAYYQSTYVRVQMIYIPYVDFVLNEDGDRIWDQASGQYLYTEKTGAALLEQQGKAQAVRDALVNCYTQKEFAALMEQYNEDPAAKSYPSGYYFSSEVDYSDYIPALTEVALTLAPDERAEVKTAYGVHFLLALPCDEGAYAREENADFFDGFAERLSRRLYEGLIEKSLPGVTIYREEKGKYRYEDAAPNFDLYW